jgi:hypothetical protein
MAGAYTSVNWETVEEQGDSSLYKKSLTLSRMFGPVLPRRGSGD